ncbi:hypothetical protein [Tenacibaculum sp. SZ-18]|uniref:hypothetical protein n=1 Tax=Tenacibaculum sp. SZ-18 TaxID=754423 RepID=UPI0012FDB17D|nr:hypothetical protein [Tenacibaculum sp. SZ-18]
MTNLKLKLKKIDPVKSGVIYGALMGLGGLFVAFFFMLFGSVFGAATGEMGAFGAMAGSGILMMIFLPIFYFVIGFVIGILGTLLLNFILKKTDGLIIDFDKVSESEDISMIGRNI